MVVAGAKEKGSARVVTLWCSWSNVVASAGAPVSPTCTSSPRRLEARLRRVAALGDAGKSAPVLNSGNGSAMVVGCDRCALSLFCPSSQETLS